MTNPRERIDDVDGSNIREAVHATRTRIDDAARVSGRESPHVCIVAATKYLSDAATATMVEAGIGDIAENRRDALLSKRSSGIVPAATRWHFIGRLQSREAVDIAAQVDAIHTLSSARAARKLAQAQVVPTIFVQVNTDGDDAKDGLAPGDLPAFLESLPDELRVQGLSTMPARAADADGSRRAFAALRTLLDDAATRFQGRHPMQLLSMGTSQDYVVAVEEGATHVRLGRILYGSGEVRG